MAYHEAIGLAGVAAVLWAYWALAAGRLARRDPRYSALNALGAAGILVSLAYDFNLSGAVLEAVWLLASLYGLVGAVRDRRTASR
jgi:hypothetical protein